MYVSAAIQSTGIDFALSFKWYFLTKYLVNSLMQKMRMAVLLHRHMTMCMSGTICVTLNHCLYIYIYISAQSSSICLEAKNHFNVMTRSLASRICQMAPNYWFVRVCGSRVWHCIFYLISRTCHNPWSCLTDVPQLEPYNWQTLVESFSGWDCRSPSQWRLSPHPVQGSSCPASGHGPGKQAAADQHYKKTGFSWM